MAKIKEILSIDHDDVIVKGGFLYLINEYLGTNYKEEEFTDYYMQDVIPEEQKKDFFKYFLTKNMYEYCTVEEGAAEIIKELKKYYEVFIATSFIIKEIVDDSGILVGNKFKNLRQILPFLNPDNFVFLGNKSILKSHIHIDDKGSNLLSFKRNLLYTAYHNQNIPDKELKLQKFERVNNWQEIEQKLLIKK
ncbi:MAG: hypothetical protein PHQ89_02860 [Bacilli bacterium]|nr:hypothetical protein [Bacilli bacterium]